MLSERSAKLIDPVRKHIYAACLIRAIAAAAGVMPYVAVAELARTLLSDHSNAGERAWTIVWFGIVALVVRLACELGANGITHLADNDFQFKLRQRLAERLGSIPLGWFGQTHSGLVKRALQDDIVALHHVVGHAYVDAVAALVTPVVAIGYLFWVDWRLSLICLLPIATGAALYGLQFRHMGPSMDRYNAALGKVNTAAVEFVQGIAVLKTFGQASMAKDRFRARAHAFMDYFWNWIKGQLSLLTAADIALSPLLSILVVMTAGICFVSAGYVQASTVIPFIVVAPGLTAPLLTLAYSHNEMMLAKDAADRISDLLDTPVMPPPQKPCKPVGCHITFRDVTFSYDHKTDVLRNINLELEPGTVTALVGPSGSGKTSLARLLPRFWDPSAGEITLGGVPLSEIPQSLLYKLVGFVFQDVQLLRISIAENIALARPDAALAEITAAAKAAQIHDRIEALPHGYDTIAGEGTHLSGGEAQRVAIARALLADAPILVLDEATAFADPGSEAAIQDALSELVAGRTLLVIAHRLKTIAGADQICVLDGGTIVERGRHEELLEAGGLYSRLWHASEGEVWPTELEVLE